MIGGYIFNRIDPGLDFSLQSILGSSFARIVVWNRGYLFHDHPYGTSVQPARRSSGDLIVLSEDLLVTAAPGGDYHGVDLESEFAQNFESRGPAALDLIDSDFRMAALSRKGSDTILHLASNRAGSGRIYYHVLESGVLFSSDLRFLLQLVPFDVSHLAIYSLLKYGAIPEPLTITRTVSAVPPAHCLEYDVLSGKHTARPYFRLRFHPEPEISLEPVKTGLRKSARFLGRFRSAMLLSGGIDSSLYGCYLNDTTGEPPRGYNCAFDDDPELPFAQAIAGRLGVDLQIARMGPRDAIGTLDDVIRLTDHPFSDFSSLPTTFLLKYVREHSTPADIVIECNGGDDCFGFPDLTSESKVLTKHRFPKFLKSVFATFLRNTPHWELESHSGALARIAALADAHEKTPLDYLLVLAPVAYLGLNAPGEWDERLHSTMESVFAGCAEDYPELEFKAKVTVRQLMHVNSRRWAAKALSVGESLGLRVVYPYIWQTILREQGRLPWSAKVHDGVVKWPLKKLLEEFMPAQFIYRKKSGFVPPFARWLTEREFNGKVRDILLSRDALVTTIVTPALLERLINDALRGERLRHSILNFLWAAIFVESWLRQHARKA